MTLTHQRSRLLGYCVSERRNFEFAGRNSRVRQLAALGQRIDRTERLLQLAATFVQIAVTVRDRPKLRRPVTFRWKGCENYLGHEVAGLLAFGAKAFSS